MTLFKKFKTAFLFCNITNNEEATPPPQKKSVSGKPNVEQAIKDSFDKLSLDEYD
jgi:hypothetical protein